uniref:Uncharacterized protein n=1 Tax=Anguilla anguilla TaxID=7936 RepID=A0A0E9VFA4_ANGAN
MDENGKCLLNTMWLFPSGLGHQEVINQVHIYVSFLLAIALSIAVNLKFHNKTLK